MKIAVFSALGVLVTILLVMAAITRVRYRIGSRHVKVLLFGVCLRRIVFTSIESVSKRPGPGWTERWWSTMKPKHRLIYIRRKRGLTRNFAITPKNRYIFKADLERAMLRSGVPVPAKREDSSDPDTSADLNELDSSPPRQA